MKKIYIIDEAVDKVGGVERIINTLANELSKKNQVNVISLYKTNDSEFFKYNDDVKITYIYDARGMSIFSNKNKVYRKISMLLSNIVIAFRLQNIKKKIKPTDRIIIGRVRVAWKFIQKFKNSNYIYVRDAIHLLNCRLYEKIIMNFKFPKYLRRFIVSSNESIEYYNNFFTKKINMVKIYNPLGITPIVNYNSNSKTIIAVGRDDSQKAYSVLIDAFKLVQEKNKDWKLEIVGVTNDNKSIINQINNLDIKNNVILSPATKNISKKLSESAIYVMTSRYEGYANALVEALSCGIPSISFDWYMGSDEIIKNNENGKIVKLKNRLDYFNGIDCKENSVNLAKAIISLIVDKNKRIRMSKKATEIIKTRDKNVILEKWKKILELD